MSEKSVSVEEIEAMALRGEDTSAYFGEPEWKEEHKDLKIRRVQRVNVDFAQPMLEELDAMAIELNISRQAVIKMFLRLSLDQHYMATKKSA